MGSYYLPALHALYVQIRDIIVYFAFNTEPFDLMLVNRKGFDKLHQQTIVSSI